jgi:GNAT superfamily N-acetyltransferase
MDAATAWESFIAGFTDTGYARRHAARFRAGPLDGVRFERGEQSGESFEELFARGCGPAETLDAIAAHRPQPRHYLTVLEDRPGLRAAYESAGYRLDDTEALMVRELAEGAPTPSAEDVALVRDIGEADWLNASDPQGAPWALPENLADPRMAHYAIVRDGRLVARGRNIRLDAERSFVSRVFVAEAWRGQGLAKALMARLLADDAARGARWSVLTASRMGEPLYARLGYRPLGTILIFEPAHEP